MNTIQKRVLKLVNYTIVFVFHVLIFQAQNDSSAVQKNFYYISGGLSFNTFYANKIKLSSNSPLSGYLETGLFQKITSKYLLNFSLNYQPFILNHYSKEFYDNQNWTSVNIVASYMFHKLNSTVGINYSFNKILLGAGIGLSYTMESTFKLENFGCAYPYGSTAYQNIRNYYYNAFNMDNKGVILNKVLSPFVQFNLFYNISYKFKLFANMKYEFSKVPDNNSTWYLFRMMPVSMGVLYHLN